MMGLTLKPRPMRFAICLLVLVTSCGTDAPHRADLEDDLERIDQLVQEAFATGASAGLGVGIAIDGRIAYVNNQGYRDVTRGLPADDDTYWYVASTSKSFTGFGIALLAERGEVDVNAPISTYLPEYQWPDGTDPDLTLADFLGHTHGLGNGPIVLSAAFTGEFEETDWPRLIQYHEVGSRELDYSNLGYNVASMVISAKRPEGWKSFLREQVYEPAGLDDLHAMVSEVDTDRIAKPHGARADGTLRTEVFAKRDATMNAAGGHIGTIESLTRWAIVQMDQGMIDGEQVFPATAVTRGQEVLRTHDRQFAFFQRDGWAMGWDVGSFRGEPMVSRFGGYASTRSHLSFLPEQRIGVVAMTNGPGGSILTDIVAAYAYDVLMDHPDADSLAHARLAEVRAQVAELPERIASFEEVQRSRLRPYPTPLEMMAGTYRSDALGDIHVVHVRDTLRVAWGVLESQTTVMDAERHVLRHELLGNGSTIRFVFDGEGPPAGIELFGYRASRVR